MNKLDNSIQQIKDKPEITGFDEVISLIDKYYRYTPTRFTNGADDEIIVNDTGSNEGSCKIFSLARIHRFDKNQTLNCFGKFYREDVLLHPEGSDHANIRTFIKYGWDYINFNNDALQIKQ